MNSTASVLVDPSPRQPVVRPSSPQQVKAAAQLAAQLEERATELEDVGLVGVCTVPEAMVLTGASRRTIYHWIDKGWITVRYTPSGHRRVVIASLQQQGD